MQNNPLRWNDPTGLFFNDPNNIKAAVDATNVYMQDWAAAYYSVSDGDPSVPIDEAIGLLAMTGVAMGQLIELHGILQEQKGELGKLNEQIAEVEGHLTKILPPGYSFRDGEFLNPDGNTIFDEEVREATSQYYADKLFSNFDMKDYKEKNIFFRGMSSKDRAEFESPYRYIRSNALRNGQYDPSAWSNIDQLLSDHATSSKSSGFVSITQNPATAFYFAMDGSDPGYSVAIIQTDRAIPNLQNPHKWQEEFLVRGLITSPEILAQVPIPKTE